MPYRLLLQINPDCLAFINQAQLKKNISARQNTFIESINDLHKTIEQLKSPDSSVFTPQQKSEISRGAFYALTKSLEKKINGAQLITLPDLQLVLNKEFHIQENASIDFIIKSLLEPNSLPFALSIPAYSFLTGGFYWSNECTNPEFKCTLKAKPGPSEGSIIIRMMLYLKNSNASQSSNSPEGFAHIQFIVDQEKQIKLNALNTEFNFINEKEFQQFKQEICRDFQDWIFSPKTYWNTTDIWVLPILLGCFVGLIAMISLVALHLIPIMPLLLPPLGLALGLCIAGFIQTCVRIDIKKERLKLNRPIHILNASSLSIPHHKRQTTSFFQSSPPHNIHSAETRFSNLSH